MGLTPSTADALLAAGVDVITSGNHIWDKREIYPYLETSERVLRPLNYGDARGPGPRLGRLPGARRHRHRGHQPPGPDVHAADREPVHRRRPPARRVVRAAAAGPPGRLPLRADLREERARASTSTAGSARSSARTPTSSPATSGSCPGGTAYQTDLGHDRADLERDRVRLRGPSCRGSSTRCRRGSRSGDGPSSSTPPRSTSIRPPGARSRSSGSSGSSRPDVTDAPRASARPRRATRHDPAAPPDPVVPPGPVARSTCTRTRRRSDGVLEPADLVAAAAACGVTTLRADRSRHARRLSRGRRGRSHPARARR